MRTTIELELQRIARLELERAYWGLDEDELEPEPEDDDDDE